MSIRRRGRPRVLRSALGAIAFSAIGAGGCSFSATFDTPPVYRLVAVNEDGLPAAPGFGVTILSGTFELGLAGECLHSQRIREGSGPSAVERAVEIECEWSRSGDQIAMTFEPEEYAASMSGVIRGETLTITRDTGIRCVTTPCPSTWVEEYVRERSGV